MKKNYIALILFSTWIFLINTGCPSHPELTKSIVFELGGEGGTHDSLSMLVSDTNKVDETLNIIKERLNTYGIANRIERNPKTNDYTLWMPEKVIDNAVKRLISARGKVEIWETWNIFTGGPPQPDDSVYKYTNYSSSRLTSLLVPRKELNEAKEMMKRYAETKEWPQNIKYVEGQKPVEKNSDMYELYMLRSSGRVQMPAITNDHIEKSSSGQEHNMWVISVVLNNTGSSRFEKITRNNIGQPLAIVIDNKVYSAPTVSDAISGGRIQIFGNFTKDEAQEFASIFKYKPLPLSVKIKE